MRYKNLCELRAHDRTAMPVVGKNGQVLINAGVPLTEASIASLRNHGHCGAVVDDEASDGIVYEPAIPVKMKMDAVAATREADVEACHRISEQIADEIMSTNGAVKTALEDIGNMDASTAVHSVSVAVYAGTTAVLMGYPYERVAQVVETALLHDVGKLQISEAILKKKDLLTVDELAEIRKHPRLGYDALKDLPTVPSVVRVSVLQHHENVDGTGYPMGLKRDDIYEYARIIHVCDVYDALVSKRCYKDELSPVVAVRYIAMNAGSMFDEKIAAVFLRSIAPFPEGAQVVLASGETGTVQKVDPNHPIEPVVRLHGGGVVDTFLSKNKIENLLY